MKNLKFLFLIICLCLQNVNGATYYNYYFKNKYTALPIKEINFYANDQNNPFATIKNIPADDCSIVTNRSELLPSTSLTFKDSPIKTIKVVFSKKSPETTQISLGPAPPNFPLTYTWRAEDHIAADKLNEAKELTQHFQFELSPDGQIRPLYEWLDKCNNNKFGINGSCPTYDYANNPDPCKT